MPYMIEAVELRFGPSPMLELGSRDRDEVLRETVVMIPNLPKDFRYDDFKVEITPVREVVILPVFMWDGRDLKSEDLKDAFLGGWLGLYTPQRTEGDQFLVEVTEGLKTSNQRRSAILMQFQEGEWKRVDFQLPLTVQSGEATS